MKINFLRKASEKIHGKSGRVKPAVIVTIAVIACLLAVSGVAAAKFIVNVDEYPSGIKINGVDVSGLTTKQAYEKITDEWSKKTIKVKDTTDNSSITVKNTGFTYDIEQELEEILHPGYFRAIGRKLSGGGKNYTIAMTPVKLTKSFKSQINQLACIKDTGRKKTKDAYVNMSTTDFKIVKEVYGTNIDKTKLYNAVAKAMALGKSSYSFKEKDFYEQPSVTSESSKLRKQVEYCKKYLSIKIKYIAPLTSYTIKPADLNKMITVDENGNITVDEKAVRSFVKNKLEPNITSAWGTRKLKTVGGSYTVTGGNYGYHVNVKKETAALIEDLKKGEDVTRCPKLTCFASGLTSESDDDIGDTYVEIDISRQHMWIVKNGKTIVSTSVVTGKTSDGHATPYGTYSVAYKQTNATLTGKNADGSDYESHVNYWIPFNGGIGIHDANWRSSFGGSIYISNGSHGCVNTPPSVMGKVYANVTAGEPVIVHG
jgi:lipoprotein-anchoring transpeptidase ErfK/SrfK